MMVFVMMLAAFAVIGATRVVPVVWAILGAVALASLWAAIQTKRPIWLAAIPLFALPLFLLGGVQGFISPEQAQESPSVSQAKPRTIQDVASKLSSLPFGK